MNKIKGKIKKIDTNGLISELFVESNSEILKILLLQVPAGFKEGDEAEFFFKESEVIIARKALNIDKYFISIENIIEGNIQSIKSGEIFTEVKALSPVGSITVLTEKNAFEKLGVTEKSQVLLLIKANSIGIGAPE